MECKSNRIHFLKCNTENPKPQIINKCPENIETKWKNTATLLMDPPSAGNQKTK